MKKNSKATMSFSTKKKGEKKVEKKAKTDAKKKTTITKAKKKPNRSNARDSNVATAKPLTTPLGKDSDLIDTLISDWGRERPDLDASAMAVVGRLLRVSVTLDARINEVLKPHGLLYSEFDALATLLRSGDPYELTPTELQEAVVLTSGAMTALLNRLTKKGLVARRRSKVDGRSLTARLTAKGVKLTNKLIALRFDEANDAISELTQKQRSDIARLLKTFGQRLASTPEI
ncbi:MAG: MarR family transcriptional regulator [Pseudomonadota bacterium]